MGKKIGKIIDYSLNTTKILAVLGGLSSSILLYQANILDKYNKILGEYNKIEKKDFNKISENLIENYELEAADSLVRYTILDSDSKSSLLTKIQKKKESINYKIDSLGKCIQGKTNGSDLSNYCSTGIMFTPVGDIIDLVKEGTKSEDEKIDKLTIGLSVLGLAVTVGAVYSGGLTLPAKGVIGSIKKLHKLNQLPRWLIKKISEIKSVKNIDDDTLSILKKLGVLFDKTNLETAGKLLYSTKSVKQLDNIITLLNKYPVDIKNFMKISSNDFLKSYEKYGDKFDFDIYKKAFLIKGGFKMLNKKGIKGFNTSITKPKYPGSKVRGLKVVENIFGKIANLYLFIQNLIISLGASFFSFLGARTIQKFRLTNRENNK